MVTWDVIDASVRGSSHVRRGAPNQDAVATRVLAQGRVVVAAVSDGHGGDRYVRSDLGSRFAVEIACDVLSEWWSSAARDRSAHIERDLRHVVVPRITRLWRERVTEHAGAHPFTIDERDRAEAILESQPLIAYGATLLLAVASNRSLVLAQLGDGDIVLVRGEAVDLPIEPDERLVASQTTSLCLDTADDDFRFAVLSSVDDVDLVLLSTDGYANSFADDDWEGAVGRDLAARISELGIDAIRLQLPGWVGESAAASGDDTSIALIVPTSQKKISAEPPSSSSSLSLRRVALLCTVALVVGICSGWLWGNATANPSPSRDRPPVAGSATKGAAVGGGVDAVRPVIVASPGVGVAFTPDPNHASPLRVPAATAGIVTRVTAAGAVWDVSSTGELSVTTFARSTPVPLKIAVAAITAAGPDVWAIDGSATTLVPVDVASRVVLPAIAIPASTNTGKG